MWAAVLTGISSISGAVGIGTYALTSWKRREPLKVKRLPVVVRGWLRLVSIALYVRAEDRFLRRHPSELELASRARGEFEKELGLAPASTKRDRRNGRQGPKQKQPVR
jgi:hypothetical protein